MKGIASLKKYYQKVNDFIDPKAVILMYHRVADLNNYAYQIVVTPEHFHQHMAYLRQAFQPIRLDELVEAVKGGQIPRRAVVITFDDGYADNYLNALPILEKFQIPATIFVSSGYVDKDQEYWWDDLERILLSPGAISDHLKITIHGQEYSWSLKTTEERRIARKELHRLIKPLYPDERNNILNVLTQWACLDRQGRVEHRPLKCDELKRLADSPVIQIGGHTLHHPQLAALPVELQYQEILQDLIELETITGKPIKTFSYPFGDSGDFSSDTANIVREAGFKAACTTEHARVVRRADVYRLPRYWVGDWGPGEFQKHMADFFRR